MDAKSDGLRDDFKAGFKLLTKFQDQWEYIHHKSETNVIKAKHATKKLNSLEESCIKRVDALNCLMTSYRSLSKLDEQIKIIDSDLRLLESTFPQIEDLLIVLKNHNENITTSQTIETMKANLETQMREEKCLSDARREKLNNEHRERVEAFEMEQQRQLDERRQILEKAFEEEKSRYLQKIKEPRH